MEKQYIDKNAITEEIERLIKSPILSKSENIETRIAVLEYLLSFINTIEIKEVDLDEEIKSFTMSKELYEADSAIKAVAEHFYELGLKTHCIEDNL